VPTATLLLVFGREVAQVDGCHALTPASAARVRAAVEHAAAHAEDFRRAAHQGRTPRIVFAGGWAEACEGAAEPPAGCREGDLMLDRARAAGLDRYADLRAESRSRSAHPDPPTVAEATMIVLLPVYQPGNRLLRLVTDLRATAPADAVVVVDDGSGPASDAILDGAGDLGCAVLRHRANRGKGVALKTGFRHAAQAYPGGDVVSADADGQHSVEDISRVAGRVRDTGRMTLGVRRFAGDVPPRSQVGNDLTALLFRTATGLRGYPADLLPWLSAVPGERFEYQMNVLLHAARDGHPVEEVGIATTYLADNASSHFGSLSDSARVYRPLLRFAARSLLTPGRARR
jgi:hypothetical protein